MWKQTTVIVSETLENRNTLFHYCSAHGSSDWCTMYVNEEGESFPNVM